MISPSHPPPAHSSCVSSSAVQRKDCNHTGCKSELAGPALPLVAMGGQLLVRNRFPTLTQDIAPPRSKRRCQYLTLKQPTTTFLRDKFPGLTSKRGVLGNLINPFLTVSMDLQAQVWNTNKPIKKPCTHCVTNYSDYTLMSWGLITSILIPRLQGILKEG